MPFLLCEGGRFQSVEGEQKRPEESMILINNSALLSLPLPSGEMLHFTHLWLTTRWMPQTYEGRDAEEHIMAFIYLFIYLFYIYLSIWQTLQERETTRLKNSFYPQAVRLLNDYQTLMTLCICTIFNTVNYIYFPLWTTFLNCELHWHYVLT